MISLVFSSILFLQAEYRVYQYMIRSRELGSANRRSFVVTSSLPSQSYLAYHGGSNSIEIEMLDTWMCPGKTGPSNSPCLSPSQLLSLQEAKQ